MSAAVFYVLAVLIVLAALASVLAPTTRFVLLAVMAGDILVGILLMAAGAYVVGAVALVAPALCLAAVSLLLRRSGTPLLADIPGRAVGWPYAVAAATALGILLVWTAAARVEDTARSSAGPDLLTVLHYRTPVAVAVLVALALTALGGALLVGRPGDDERVLDRAAEQRRLREERTRQRRENRAAARAQRGAGRGPAR